jgi:hypothetical protein
VVHSPSLRAEDWLRFVQMDPFPRLWAKLQLTDEDLQTLEIGIMASPSTYPVIPGCEGLRKLRFTTNVSNRGKSGSYRVFYVYFPDYGTVLLMAILAKSDKSDLTKADKNALAQVISRIKHLLERGAIQ